MKKMILFLGIFSLTSHIYAVSDVQTPNLMCNEQRCIEVKNLGPATKIENINQKGNDFSAKSDFIFREKTTKIYKYKDSAGQTVYGDEKPEHQKSQTMDLESSHMKNKVSVIDGPKYIKKHDPQVQRQLKKQLQKEERLSELKQELYLTKNEFLKLDATQDEDWTFVGRRRVLSPSYEQKSRILAEKVSQIEREIYRIESSNM